MEKIKQQLKSYSFVLLIIALLNLVNVVLNTILSISAADSAVTPEISKGLVIGAIMVAAALTLVIVALQAYAGMKGLQVIKLDYKETAHIKVAKVLFVLAIISCVITITSFSSAKILNSIIDIAMVVIDVIVTFMYIKYANEYNNCLRDE